MPALKKVECCDRVWFHGTNFANHRAGSSEPLLENLAMQSGTAHLLVMSHRTTFNEPYKEIFRNRCQNT